MDREKLIKLGIDESLIDDCLGLFAQEFAKMEEGYKEDIKNIKINNSLELLTKQFNGKNLKAITSLIDMEKVSIDEDGKVSGILEQFEALAKGEDTSFLFSEEKVNKNFKGVSPISYDNITCGITKEDFDNMSYKEQLEIYNDNNELYNELTK